MKISTIVELDRQTHSIYPEVEATVTKHFGQLEVSDFLASLKLTADEIDQAQEALIEKAKQEAMGLIPEEEPDCWRYGR